MIGIAGEKCKCDFMMSIEDRKEGYEVWQDWMN